MIDHIVYGVHDLDAEVGSLASTFGVSPSFGGQHVGLGTANHLLDVGDGAYLEIIGPDPTQPPPEQARPFNLDLMMTGGVITWCARVDDLDTAIVHAGEAGFAYTEPQAMQRRSPGGLLSWRLSFPDFENPGGVVPFLIQWDDDVPHPSASAAKGLHLTSMHGTHPAPGRAEGVLAALGLDLEVRRAPQAGLVVRLATTGGEAPLRVASFG